MTVCDINGYFAAVVRSVKVVSTTKYLLIGNCLLHVINLTYILCVPSEIELISKCNLSQTKS